MVISEKVLISWTDVKSLADAGSQMYYVEELYRYRPFIVNNNNILFTNLIFPSKYSERGVAVSDQAAFTIIHDDFIDNYKAAAIKEPQLFNPGILQVQAQEGGFANVLELDTFASSTIASGSTLTLISYTVPADRKARILGTTIGGSNYGLFELFMNSVLKWRSRNSRGDADPTITFPRYIQLDEGDSVDIKATNASKFTSTYEVKSFGFEYDK